MVPEDWEGFAASEHIIRIIPCAAKLHPGYLYSYLSSNIGQKLLRDGVFGSVVDEINCNYIASLPILHLKDSKRVKAIGEKIIEANRLRSQSARLIIEASEDIEQIFL